MKLMIVTGMSGSGKSKALNNLEDNGFYCLDNLPLKLLPGVLDMLLQLEDFSQKVAVTADVRDHNIETEIDKALELIEKRGVETHILFLDCNDDVLLKRYKESRRIHPLMMSWDRSIDISTAITEERHILEQLRQRADYVVDTSLLSTSELRSKLMDVISTDEQESMHIYFVAFGYKYGIPADADIVFDVRCLPNPYYVDELRDKTGEDREVRDFVMKSIEAQKLLSSIISYLECAIPMYEREGKAQLIVALGCTGGQHRSLTFAILLQKYFEELGMSTKTVSRDKDTNIQGDIRRRH